MYLLYYYIHTLFYSVVHSYIICRLPQSVFRSYSSLPMSFDIWVILKLGEILTTRKTKNLMLLKIVKKIFLVLWYPSPSMQIAWKLMNCITKLKIWISNSGPWQCELRSTTMWIRVDDYGTVLSLKLIWIKCLLESITKWNNDNTEQSFIFQTWEINTKIVLDSFPIPTFYVYRNHKISMAIGRSIPI